MAAFFGGSSTTRRPLKDIEIQDILGDGNLSDIEGLDNEDEISPFSLLDWLEGDSPGSQNVVEELDAPNEAMCNSSTLNSTLVTTGTLSNDCFEQHNVDQTLTSNTSCRATSLARPSRGRKKKTSGLLRSKSTPTSQQLSASRNTTARHASTPRPDSTQKKTHKSRAKSTCTSKQAADAATSMLARTNTRRQIGQPWQQLPFQNKPHEYPPPPVKEVREPIDYYNEYMNDDFFERISYCTNMYHLRKTGKELKTNRAEIMHLFGIHILMGCIPYPRWKMYWRKGISMDKITSVMTRDRFSTLRNALHVVDTDTPPPGNTNFLWKVQPMLDQIRKGCYKQERVPGFYSVDEQMIPFTGRCAIRQVVKNKPRPVGLKNFVLTTSTGLMLDFDIYKGAKTMFGPDMSLGLGPAVVLHLSRSVPPGSCIYHDRYFTTIPLVEELGNRNIHSTGTIMTNRIPERSTLKFKDDKTMQRGESQQMVRGSVAVVKWKDNKSVFLTSNCSGSDKTEVVKRWDKKARSYVDVTAPQIVMNYNRHMGGVDVLDQQMEYYRTFIKTKKWTLKVLIHFSDLATVNAWRAYKIDCDANKYPGCKILDLLDFRMELHEVLVKAPPKRRNEVLTHEASDDEMPVMPRKYQKPANPPVSLIYDGYDHLPEFDDIKSPRACQFHRCCSRTKTRCIKCNVYLCIARNQNCFKMYHTK